MSDSKKSGWGIFFRIILILVVIGGVFAIGRGIYYIGYKQGAVAESEGFEDSTFFHDGWGLKPHGGYPGGTNMPHQMVPGGVYYPSRGLFGGGIFRLMFGVLGFIILMKIIMGITGVNRYRWMKGGDPDGKGYRMPPPFFYHPHHRHHHRYRCDCGCEDEGEDGTEEPPAEEKPTKKKS